MKIFAFDGALSRSLEKVFDMMVLHFLWVICSLPIFTIGASTTALCSVNLKITRKEEGYVVRSFFKAWKENFKKSTAIWLCFLAFFIWCISMIVISFQAQTGGYKILALVEAAILLLGVAAASYVFFIQAYFENSMINTIKNAFVLSLKYLPQTLLMIAGIVLPILMTAYFTQGYAILLFLWLFFGSSAINLFQASIVNKVFAEVSYEK